MLTRCLCYGLIASRSVSTKVLKIGGLPIILTLRAAAVSAGLEVFYRRGSRLSILFLEDGTCAVELDNETTTCPVLWLKFTEPMSII